MKYPTVSVNGVSVRVDSEGRYNLNDLHSAAVANGQATESQRPSNFTKSKSIKVFVDELTAATKIAALKTINGGPNHGVWGLELVAIRYAAWLNPKFEIRVYNTFRECVLDVVSNMNRLNRLDLLIASEAKEVSSCARTMNRWGVGGRKKLLNGTRDRIVSQMDPDMVELMEVKPY
ncbi:KilA-N domain-containing protein [Trabulsiella odontotermitis]|uniref:KilA-N domain-containing protein n=1 Tax=Trabulsiella odontotermitis TaxID=379893 RepID=UPI0006BA415C|nr:KilA-N domain-containing protein [Trabulsiella odontotermitis]